MAELLAHIFCNQQGTENREFTQIEKCLRQYTSKDTMIKFFEKKIGLGAL